jgi:hypothetical protein
MPHHGRFSVHTVYDCRDLPRLLVRNLIIDTLEVFPDNFEAMLRNTVRAFVAYHVRTFRCGAQKYIATFSCSGSIQGTAWL